MQHLPRRPGSQQRVGCTHVKNNVGTVPCLRVHSLKYEGAPLGARQRHAFAGQSSRCSPTGLQAVNSPSPAANASEIIDVDLFAKDRRPIILFDGVCNLCNGGVNFVLDWDKEGVYRLAALQSAAGRKLLTRCGRAPDDISSIVLVEPDTCHTKSDAVLRIATRLGMPLPLLAGLALAVPNLVRDVAYDQVAANRYLLFGRTQACRLSDAGFASRFIPE